MSNVEIASGREQTSSVMNGGRQPQRFIVPSLAPLYESAKPLAYAALRCVFGIVVITHGIPKLTPSSGALASTTNMISNMLQLPFAPQLAFFVALLETFGGMAIAVGAFTRPLAGMLAVQMVFIAVALGPAWAWTQRGIEYPVLLAFVALLLAFGGSGALSVDRRIGREL